MDILKRENWWIWLMLFIFSGGVSAIVLAAVLGIFDRNAWYAKTKNWIIGIVLIFPAPIMFMVFTIQMLSQSAAKLKVPGSEIYLSPYIWLICVIIPIMGWIALTVMSSYLYVMILINLYDGHAEKYIK